MNKMIELTETDRRLLLWALDTLQAHQSRAGCNDLDLVSDLGLRRQEALQLALDVNVLYAPAERKEKISSRCHPDVMYVEYLRHRLVG